MSQRALVAAQLAAEAARDELAGHLFDLKMRVEQINDMAPNALAVDYELRHVEAIVGKARGALDRLRVQEARMQFLSRLS